MESPVVALLVAAAFTAGWVDAVVGGGGLVMLPVLLLTPGVAPVEAVATNKAMAIAGTTASSVTYYRRVRPRLAAVLPTAALAAVFAGVGALVAASVPGDVLKPVVLAALVVAATYTLLRPELGDVTALRFTPGRHRALATVAGAVLGFYDGIAGPGTGAFLLFLLVGGLGYSFLEGSANAKIVNWGTNLGALVVFTLSGSVLWEIAPFTAAANLAGGYLGARTAIAAGSRFVRRAFLVVVTVLIARLGWDVATQLFQPR
ncbi:MAG: TSUP family transporter [Actinomycetota bacterium]|nr:TSUP family transporter [Actinomycetota bacterium]